MGQGQEEINYKELKKGGYIVQRDHNYFTCRLRVPAGVLNSKQTIAVGKIAEKYGRGQIHLTARQGIQIPYVKWESLNEITRELTENKTPPGSCGPRVRNVSSCVGEPECPSANIDCYELANKLDEKYVDTDTPTKLKIAVTGCPNSCAKPQVNDFGIMGVVKPKIIAKKCDGCGICVEICKEAAIRIIDKTAVVDYTKCVNSGECIRVCPRDAILAEKRGYTIFIGGRFGSHPQFGYKIAEFADEEMIFKVIENSLKILREKAVHGERLGSLVNRIGIGEFTKGLS